MVSDRDLLKQILERDAINLYRQIPSIGKMLGINISPVITLFEDKISVYIDTAISGLVDTLFGSEECDIDEASEIAKMIANDKIEEYRKRVKEKKL